MRQFISDLCRLFPHPLISFVHDVSGDAHSVHRWYIIVDSALEERFGRGNCCSHWGRLVVGSKMSKRHVGVPHTRFIKNTRLNIVLEPKIDFPQTRKELGALFSANPLYLRKITRKSRYFEVILIWGAHHYSLSRFRMWTQNRATRSSFDCEVVQGAA